MADVLEELPPEEGPNRAFLLALLILGGGLVVLLFAIGLVLALRGPARPQPPPTAAVAQAPSPSPLPPTYTPTPRATPTPIPTSTATPTAAAAAQGQPTPSPTPSPPRASPTPARTSLPSGGMPQTGGGGAVGWGLGALGVLLVAWLARRLRLGAKVS